MVKLLWVPPDLPPVFAHGGWKLTSPWDSSVESRIGACPEYAVALAGAFLVTAVQ